MDNRADEDQTEKRRIALGLTLYLERFAARRVAEIWDVFAAEDPLNWRFYLLEVVDDPGTIVFFNLHGVDAWLGVTRAASGQHSPTDWELLQIKEHEIWWPRIEWWDEDTRVTNPFE